MTHEDEVLRQADEIIAAAAEQEAKSAAASVNEALLLAEQAAWETKPLTNNACMYDIWVFTKKYSGTPEGLAEFRNRIGASDASAQHIEGNAWKDGTANACIALEHVLSAEEGKTPPNVKEVLFDHGFVIKLHTTDHFDGAPIEGLLIRSQAFASEQAVSNGKRASESDDRRDVVINLALLGDTMMAIARDATTGKFFEDQTPNFTKVVRHNGTNHDEVKECFHDLAESHGELAQAIYGAVYMPKAMRGEDPELWDAMVQDFLADEAKEDNNHNNQGEDNQ